MSIQLDTAYGRRVIRRIGNYLYAFSCEELALIRRISFLDSVYWGNVVRTATTMPIQNNTTVPNRPFKKLTQQELEENSYQTMRIKGHVKKQVLHLLVDCGGTHNFLDLHAVKIMECNLSKICPLQVSVANREVMSSVYKCKNFGWSIQGQVFETDVMILPLGGCEIVLGIQWLATLGVIQFDFKNLVMDFVVNGKRCVLRGTPQSTLQWIHGKQVNSSLSQMGVEISSMALCVCPATLMQMTGVNTESNSNIQTLLKDFSTVFDTPKELPSNRSHDHTIPLLPNTPSINVRPYKHPPNQKDAIKLMVKELLKVGVIRNSQSSFSLPIVMMKKKDGTWRMCVDYRMLNKYTMKDIFPIPVIEELLDELHGAKVFSKLDLRSGYHQIRMNKDDIHKTAFRTHKEHYEFLVIPFGLTNAPSTFQSLMNTVLKTYLRKFVLVFFDDILIYSKSEEEHWGHLRTVLQIMQQHTLFAKESKCTFAANKMEYLGHIISDKGVSTDPTKIQATKHWPIPQTDKQLRGFLGLTGYYKKFIKNYAWISKPLTNLLKMGAFVWSQEAQEAFLALKQTMILTPVLALLNFQKTFVVETDASGVGIGVVLQQGGHPIAYLSKTLAPKHQALSTYEKEFLTILMTLEKWRGYLLDRHFKIKTYHFSLKFLLNQRLTTPFQTKWLPKLLGFDYEISYNKGAENVVVDALSRINSGSELNAVVLSTVTNNKYTWEGGVLKRKGKLVVGNDEQLRNTIVQHYHADAVGGHSGTTVTTHKIKSLFYWKGLHKIVKKYVRECDVCQINKSDLAAYPGLLQPLPVPKRVWSDISMDFIVGLPKSQGKSVIFVVVDSLSKYAHFMALSHPYTASFVAHAFLDSVYKLHGLPNSIVSDMDSVFLKVVNKCLECYLRCMTGERPKEWVQWLSLAEFWYNTNKHSSISVSPYEVVYSQTPPLHNPYVAGEIAVETVDRSLQARENAIEMLKFHMKRSQDRVKKYVDLKRSEIEFEVGMWIYLKLQPHRQVTIRQGALTKLSPKYFGPFMMVAKLKLCRGNALKMGFLPHCGEDGLLSVEPEIILDRRIGKVNNKAAVYFLVKWFNHNEEDTTWELAEDLIKSPEGFLARPEVVMEGLVCVIASLVDEVSRIVETFGIFGTGGIGRSGIGMFRVPSAMTLKVPKDEMASRKDKKKSLNCAIVIRD
ncbi:retrotransposon-related protein [Tanacetum coccineum]